MKSKNKLSREIPEGQLHKGVIHPLNRIKSRYFSLRNEGHEIYVEDVSKTKSREALKQIALKRLHLVRLAMPLGEWSIQIEQEIQDGGFKNLASHYEIYNPETGEETRS